MPVFGIVVSCCYVSVSPYAFETVLVLCASDIGIGVLGELFVFFGSERHCLHVVCVEYECVCAVFFEEVVH